MKDSGLRVFIAEGSPVVAGQLLNLLSSMSRKLEVITDYDLFKNRMSASDLDGQFDLFIVGVDFLVDSGLDLEGALEEALALARERGDSFVFISSDDREEHILKDFVIGKTAYVRKPLTFHKLAEALGQVGLQMRKLNCWEYNQCGRGPGHSEEPAHQVCPVSKTDTCEGMNEGSMGGRVCWAISGTFCEGSAQGTFASKVASCQECDFYKVVHEEQGFYAESINSILGRLNRERLK